jgi:hypothetical protein
VKGEQQGLCGFTSLAAKFQLVAVVFALLFSAMPLVGASTDVFTPSPDASLEGTEVVAGAVRLRIVCESWEQTTESDFERWMSNENVVVVGPGDVRLAVTAGDQWVAKDNAPYSSSYGIAATGAGDYIFILRGYWAGVKVGVGRYNTETESWENWSEPTIEWQEVGQHLKNGCKMAWDHGNYIYVLAGGSYADVPDPPDPTKHEPRYGFWRFPVGDPSSWTRLENTPWHQGPGDTLVYAEVNGEAFIYAWLGTTSKNRSRACGAKFYRYNISGGHWDATPITEIEKRDPDSGASPPYGADDGASLVWTGDDYLYYIPGAYAEGSPSCKERYFSRFVTSENRWEDLAMLPYNENPNTTEGDGVDDGGSMVWDGSDCLYVLKGGDGNGDDQADNFWRYSISSNSWEVLAGVPLGPSRNNGARLGYAGENVYYWHANSTGFWAYSPPKYKENGYFISSVFDAGVISTWQRMDWDASLPAGTTLRIWTRSSEDNIMWSGWVESQRGAPLSWENRYLQYRAEFSTTDERATPTLHGISAAYVTKIWRTGTFTSQPLTLGHVEEWGELSWDATTPENTSISFATRSSADGSGWSEWAELGSSAIRSPTYGRPFLQVRATLRGLGVATPVLRSYSISCIPDRSPPALLVTAPMDGFSAVESSISVSGTISDSNPCTLEVNDRTVLSGPGSFSTRVELSPGANTIRLVAKDVAGNERTLTLRGTRAVPEPPVRPSEREGGRVAFVAAAGVAGMAVLVAAWTLLRGPLRVER